MKLSNRFGKAKYHAQAGELASHFIDTCQVIPSQSQTNLYLHRHNKLKRIGKTYVPLQMLSSHVESKGFHYEVTVMIESMIRAIHMQIMATSWSYCSSELMVG